MMTSCPLCRQRSSGAAYRSGWRPDIGFCQTCYAQIERFDRGQMAELMTLIAKRDQRPTQLQAPAPARPTTGRLASAPAPTAGRSVAAPARPAPMTDEQALALYVENHAAQIFEA